MQFVITIREGVKEIFLQALDLRSCSVERLACFRASSYEDSGRILLR